MNTPAHRVLVARLDNLGDVLLAGPAVRAVAAAAEVVFLAGPAGAAGASLLPGVSRVLCFDSPWTGDHAPPPARAAIGALVNTLASARLDEALVLTSFHQSPLPLALLLKMAGVARVGAVCVDHPGSLLDLRHPYQPELHEVEQALALAEAFGYPLPAGDDRRLALAPWAMAAPPPRAELARPYVVVHPGA
ncbi:MAG: glycosyltransferase family 9 protein, partial [Acidimicrobiales bacterium]